MFDLESGLVAREVLWGVALWRLGVALVLIFLSFLSRRLVRFIFTQVLRKRVRTTRIRWDDDIVELMPQPLALIVQILFWYLVVVMLLLPREPTDIRGVVYNGLEVALAIGFAWVVFRLIDVLARVAERLSGATETRLDDQAVPLLRKTLKVFIGITIGVMIVQHLGYSIASLIASLGIGGLALALAAKDMVANFFGSVLIFTDRPFQVGDAVSFGSVEGTVEEVGFRTTRVRQFDKALVTVPNQAFSTTPIVNLSNRDRRRIKFTLGISYEASAAQMRTLVERLRALLAEHPGLHHDGFVVNFNAFGSASLDVLINCFTTTSDWGGYLDTQEALLLRIMEIVEEMGLEIAYPTQTLYLRDEHSGDGPG